MQTKAQGWCRIEESIKIFWALSKVYMFIIKVLEGEKRDNRAKAIFKKIMSKNFLKMGKDSQVQEIY